MNSTTSQFWFTLIITMFFCCCCRQQWNRRWQKWRWIAGNFNCHDNAAVRRGVHCPMEHIQGFTQSHWMLPSGKYLCRIAPAAAMVNKFVETTQTLTNKTFRYQLRYILIASCLWEFHTQKQTLYDTHSSMQQAAFKCETPRLELKS